MKSNQHHYAFDAAFLLRTSLKKLRNTIVLQGKFRHSALVEMEEVLVKIQHLLHTYFVRLIERHSQVDETSHDIYEETIQITPRTLTESVQALEKLIRYRENQQHNTGPKPSDCSFQAMDHKISLDMRMSQTAKVAGENKVGKKEVLQIFASKRSETDSMLFRLIVALQLCLVRINDVYSLFKKVRFPFQNIALSAACFGISAIAVRPQLKSSQRGAMVGISKISVSTISLVLFSKCCYRLWMFGKLSNSTKSLKAWKEQWMLIETDASFPTSARAAKARIQELIEVTKSQNSFTSFWQSEGELRFLVLKRAMDLLYASVGTALKVTKTQQSPREGPSWQTSLAAMAAASYLSVIGPNKRAEQALSTPSSELIQNAWGMVSLPAIKLLSLHATRLLKGASLARRIIIAGVPCLILSKDPCPVIVLALKRATYPEHRSQMVPTLDTIDEDSPIEAEEKRRGHHVIFHLTGGGFFAHTLASDLPYLLDWSKATGAVVICPEYSLLPDHTFPVALEQTTGVYTALVQGTESLPGFGVGRIIVTGESAGGNLATAMCVKLGMKVNDFNTLTMKNRESPLDSKICQKNDPNTQDVLLPDALMLSCPVLNLSLEISPSRVIGGKDPVLPSGIISAISDAYVPPHKYSKQEALVSPLFASDDVLRLFPPTLLFASSDDPLLDDAVHFNTRLRCLGIESELRATHHMPHAYWGLGTAGFPEAQQVQAQCEEFLQQQFLNQK
mmetsp:Transcript_18246/g.27634  ORF Transcript_18246/g.27634 Transcript_18246/m.27634 type:complete len:733 (+) Transcript_18246:213-2411(+)